MKNSSSLSLRWVPLAELKISPTNAKRHSIEALKKSMRRFGFVAPVLIRNDLTVVAGAGRCEALRGMGDEAKNVARLQWKNGELLVPCVCVDDLSPDEARAYALADNRLCEAGGWDEIMLSNELRWATDFLDADVDCLGWAPAQRDAVFAVAEVLNRAAIKATAYDDQYSTASPVAVENYDQSAAVEDSDDVDEDEKTDELTAGAPRIIILMSDWSEATKLAAVLGLTLATPPWRRVVYDLKECKNVS